MKPKLLLISAISPFPQTSGGATRIYHNIVELSKKYSITFITFNSPDNDFYKKYTEKFINLDLHPKSLFTPIPFRFSEWYSPELLTLINKQNFDLVQVEFSQLLYLANHFSAKTLTRFVSHDISSISFYRRIFETKNIFKIITALFFWLQIYFYEKQYLPKFNKIFTVSQTDHDLLQRHFNLPSTVVPNGISQINFLSKKPSSVLRIGYIGSFSHPPNKFAVSYFIDKIAPKLSNFQFFLAGNNPDFSHPLATNLGMVSDLKDFYSKIDVLVAPIFSGSGTRIKILEALSYGVPVISTTIGAEGLNIQSKYLQIANSPSEFIECMQHLPTKPSTKLKIILQKHLWTTTLKPFCRDQA
jgi:glycosyltransferase involved in cell wall biosynthesis